MDKDIKKYTLTEDQFAFMKRFEAVFTINLFHLRITGEADPVYKLLIESEAFKGLFGDMNIDDLLDRYSDAEGYNHDTFHNQLSEIINSQLPRQKITPPNIDPNTFNFCQKGVEDLMKHSGFFLSSESNDE